MKILVTGAAGFIGFHVVKSLFNSENQIYGIDNINDYYSIKLKEDRLSYLGINNSKLNEGKVTSTKDFNFTFEKTDISDEKKLLDLFQKEKFDVVCHLAAQAGVRYSIDNPQAYVKSNINGFANILEACRHNNVKHLIYASSSSVYGMNAQVPFSTDHKVDQPVSLYAATKRSNELMAYSYSHLYQLATTGLRFFTVYGPWGRPDMAYYLFADAIKKGERIKVFNNGNMSRDFTYVDDVVKGINLIMFKEESRKDYYRLYNIGNNAPVNLLEFISIIEDNMGKKALKEMMPMQPGDVPSTYADVSELINDFGYQPQTSLNEGISRFIGWYNSYFKK